MRKPITSAIVAILFGFFVATIVLASAGYDPVEAFGALIDGMIGKPKYIANVIIKATPLLFTGVAVAFAFRVGLFNIGAEGQYVFGTVFATIVGILLDLPPVLQIPVVLLVGMLAGAAAGALVGWLKAKFGIHEVITSIMLNWISLYFNNFVVNSEAFHKANSTKSLPINSSGYTMLFTDMKSSPDGLAALKDIPIVGDAIARTDANVGIIVAIIAAIFIGWLLMRTKVGYEMRAVGFNRDAAQFTGINVKRNLVLCMAISGALCGVAGALNITGLNPHSISVLAAFEITALTACPLRLLQVARRLAASRHLCSLQVFCTEDSRYSRLWVPRPKLSVSSSAPSSSLWRLAVSFRCLPNISIVAVLNRQNLPKELLELTRQSMIRLKGRRRSRDGYDCFN